jgi:hypothetical protein
MEVVWQTMCHRDGALSKIIVIISVSVIVSIHFFIHLKL